MMDIGHTRMRSKPAAVFLFAVLLMISMTAGDAYAGVYIKNVYARFSATAGETLALGDVVCLKDADGKAYKADANDAVLRPAIGIIGKGGASATSVEIVTQGIFGGYTSLSEGANGYLSETAGAITQSSPTWSQVLGVAISSTAYYLNTKNYFDTSAVTAVGVLEGASPLILEGATADAFETSIAVVDPTADRTITLPDKNVTIASSVLVVTADANGKSIGAAETGDLQSCGGAGVWNVPEASTCVGCVFDFAVTSAANVDINPDAADLILGLTDAAGDAIRCAAVGGTVRLIVLDATNIAAFSAYCPGGVWADVN